MTLQCLDLNGLHEKGLEEIQPHEDRHPINLHHNASFDDKSEIKASQQWDETSYGRPSPSDKLWSPIPSTAKWVASRRHLGWRYGLLLGFFSSGLVLVCNIILLSLGLWSRGAQGAGIGTIAVNTPVTINNLGVVLHMIINALSTVLLVSSNYAMQVLCAPTRAEISNAHAQSKWLDIGVVSLRNLRLIETKRAALWWILLFSSLPLHLFYNSAIFEVKAWQDYRIEFVIAAGTHSVPPGWLNLTNSQWPTPFQYGYRNLQLVVSHGLFEAYVHPNGNWSAVLVSSPSCTWNPLYANNVALLPPINMYFSPQEGFGGDYIGNQIPLRLSDSGVALPPSTIWPKPRFITFSFDEQIEKPIQLCPSSPWLVDHPFKVQNALVEPTDHLSRIEVAVPFMVIVTVSNAIKLVAIFLTYRWCCSGHILTVGDAIASFLDEPEETSLGNCLLTNSKFKQQGFSDLEQIWNCSPRRYFSMLAGKLERIGTPGACIVVIGLNISAILLLIPSKTDDSERFTSWGTASQAVLPYTSRKFNASSVLTNTLIANIPQIILSFLYFSLNRICTSICFAREWNDFAKVRKTLRVTSPQGPQRSTYFLQLPYRWAVPLAVTSGFLHWLLSQAFFLARVENWDYDGNLKDGSKSVCGYSAWALLAFSGALLAFLATIVMLVMRRVDVDIPVAAHNSMVISAACHPPPGDWDASLKAVQWGVVRNRFGGTIEHCSFTSEDVTPPVEGQQYA